MKTKARAAATLALIGAAMGCGPSFDYTI